VVACAGDPAEIDKSRIRDAAEAWAGAKHILYVPGNHEYHRTDLDAGRRRLARECEACGITLLDENSIEIDGVHFIGAALWTDFRLDGVAAEPGAHRSAHERGDFDGYITTDGRTGRFTTCEAVRRHETHGAELMTYPDPGEGPIESDGRRHFEAAVLHRYVPRNGTTTRACSGRNVMIFRIGTGQAKFGERPRRRRTGHAARDRR